MFVELVYSSVSFYWVTDENLNRKFSLLKYFYVQYFIYSLNLQHRTYIQIILLSYLSSKDFDSSL